MSIMDIVSQKGKSSGRYYTPPVKEYMSFQSSVHWSSDDEEYVYHKEFTSWGF